MSSPPDKFLVDLPSLIFLCVWVLHAPPTSLPGGNFHPPSNAVPDSLAEFATRPRASAKFVATFVADCHWVRKGKSIVPLVVPSYGDFDPLWRFAGHDQGRKCSNMFKCWCYIINRNLETYGDAVSLLQSSCRKSANQNRLNRVSKLRGPPKNPTHWSRSKWCRSGRSDVLNDGWKR